jgi:polyisoprenoid-binding protein YceI
MKRLAIALACVLPFAAQAVEYTQVQAEKSAIAFTYKQMGVAVDGRFRRFSSHLSFDPARPAAAKGSLRCRTCQRRHRRSGRRRGSSD